MITMEQVYKNSNEWIVQQYEINHQYSEKYEVMPETLFEKIKRYFKEII